MTPRVTITDSAIYEIFSGMVIEKFTVTASEVNIECSDPSSSKTLNVSIYADQIIIRGGS